MILKQLLNISHHHVTVTVKVNPFIGSQFHVAVMIAKVIHKRLSHVTHMK